MRIERARSSGKAKNSAHAYFVRMESSSARLAMYSIAVKRENSSIASKPTITAGGSDWYCLYRATCGMSPLRCIQAGSARSSGGRYVIFG